MKNVQIIDGAENCVYDIFEVTEEEFQLIFPKNTNIAFIEDISKREEQQELEEVFTKMWSHPVKKSEVKGIHGTLFYGLEEKKQYYPTLRDEEAVNPDGTALRASQP